MGRLGRSKLTSRLARTLAPPEMLCGLVSWWRIHSPESRSGVSRRRCGAGQFRSRVSCWRAGHGTVRCAGADGCSVGARAGTVGVQTFSWESNARSSVTERACCGARVVRCGTRRRHGQPPPPTLDAHRGAMNRLARCCRRLAGIPSGSNCRQDAGSTLWFLERCGVPVVRRCVLVMGHDRGWFSEIRACCPNQNGAWAAIPARALAGNENARTWLSALQCRGVSSSRRCPVRVLNIPKREMEMAETVRLVLAIRN